MKKTTMTLLISIPMALIFLVGTIFSISFVRTSGKKEKRIAKTYAINVYDIVDIDKNMAFVNDMYYCKFDPTYKPKSYTVEVDTIPAKQLEIQEVMLAVNRKDPTDFYVVKPEPVWGSLLTVMAVLAPLAFLATLYVLTKVVIEEHIKKRSEA